jgi:hypothetical protein
MPPLVTRMLLRVLRLDFEYSFTDGKSVTRVSLYASCCCELGTGRRLMGDRVINTTAILPPLVWLSKHPMAPPTKTGARGKLR